MKTTTTTTAKTPSQTEQDETRVVGARKHFVTKLTDVISDLCGVTADDITRDDRLRANRTAAFLLAWCIARSYPCVSMQTLGRYMHRTRVNVYHMIKRAEDLLSVYPEYRGIVKEAAERCGGLEGVNLLRIITDFERSKALKK